MPNLAFLSARNPVVAFCCIVGFACASLSKASTLTSSSATGLSFFSFFGVVDLDLSVLPDLTDFVDLASASLSLDFDFPLPPLSLFPLSDRLVLFLSLSLPLFFLSFSEADGDFDFPFLSFSLDLSLSFLLELFLLPGI